MDFTAFTGTAHPARKDGWSGALKIKFLDHLATKGTVRGACAAAGMSAEAAYRLRRRDALFARGWAAALVLAREAGSDELACRALDGVEEEIWYRGEMVGTRRKYDTRLLLAHLARLDRLVEQSPGEGDAARFQELLAALAEGESSLASPDDPLPPSREDFISKARERAWSEAYRTPIEQPDGEGEFDEEERRDGYYPEDTLEQREDAAWAAGEEAATEAGARWDEWFARGSAAVAAACAEAASPRRLRGSASLLSTVSTLSTSGLGLSAQRQAV
ncbi:hypothetical protein [Erythrobacter sp. SG61-1L]|uniref:hypothetical protein n=1 Tax=Erythrobacter sp. SG61-1L TaxID=1603897 RepID=UPI0006C8F033|nr:hypothetical protein [Erythrobacter sp. SG61-1L]